MALTQISTAGVKDDAVTSGKIPANAVGSSELADNAVDNAAVASNAAIAGSKIAPSFTANTTITAASPVLRLADSTDPVGTDGVVGKLEFYGSDGSSGGADVRSFIQTISTNSVGNAHALTIGLGESNNAPTEKIRILGDGKVGIGTTSPAELLHLQSTAGNTKLRLTQSGSTTDAVNGAIHFGNSTDGQLCEIRGYTSGSNNSGYLQFRTTNSGSDVTAMTINTTGNVGIGTSSPAGKLHVSDGYHFLAVGGNSTTGMKIGNYDGTNYGVLTTRGSQLRFDIGDNNKMVLDASGKLGIGTSSPNQELHVKGAGTVATFEGTGGSSFIGIKDSDDSTIAFVGVDGGNLKFQTSGSSYSDKLVINTSGNVGIGETAPADNRIRSTSPHTYNIVAKSSNGNGGYHNFTGVSSTGSITSYISHNGRVGASDGIIFGSDTAAANVLDDYEEGTFTPLLKGTSGGGTLTAATVAGSGGNYTKVGNKVHLSFFFANPSGSNPSGTLYFELPFNVASGNSNNGSGGCVTYTRNIFPESGRMFAVNAIAGTDRLYITRVSVGGQGETAYQTINNDSNLTSMLFKATVSYVAA
jgi:hypothetical protein